MIFSEMADGLDGDYEVLEGLLAKGGVMKPQAQKSFLYLCYRQQFLEFIENRKSQTNALTTHCHLMPSLLLMRIEYGTGWTMLIPVYRSIPKSIRVTYETSKTSRTLPTNPIRFLQSRLPDFSGDSP